MKRLLILTAAAMLTAGATGCWHWFNRGAACNTCAPGATTYPDAYMAPPSVSPGYDSTLPAPQ